MVRLKVMVSSVRNGLADVRDAVRPLLDVLGYEPIRFEDFTPRPIPSRAVCVNAVTQSDIYLLLLGELYGDPIPDTGLAPTAEEWTTARAHGKPVVAFRRIGVSPEPRQAEFIAEVEAYATGVFRGTFTDTADLLGKLKDPLAAAGATLQPMRPRRLTEPISVPWRPTDQWSGGHAGVVLETHILPVGPIDPIRAASFPELSRRLARAGRDHGLFGEGDALTFPTTETSVTAQSAADGRRAEAGLTLTSERAIGVWETLPSQIGGSIFDESQIAARIVRDIRIAAALGLVNGDEVTVATGLDRVDRLGRATGPNSMTFPFFGQGNAPVRLEPLDAIPSSALSNVAEEVASELVSRLSLRLGDRS